LLFVWKFQGMSRVWEWHELLLSFKLAKVLDVIFCMDQSLCLWPLWLARNTNKWSLDHNQSFWWINCCPRNWIQISIGLMLQVVWVGMYVKVVSMHVKVFGELLGWIRLKQVDVVGCLSWYVCEGNDFQLKVVGYVT